VYHTKRKLESPPYFFGGGVGRCCCWLLLCVLARIVDPHATQIGENRTRIFIVLFSVPARVRVCVTEQPLHGGKVREDCNFVDSVWTASDCRNTVGTHKGRGATAAPAMPRPLLKERPPPAKERKAAKEALQVRAITSNSLQQCSHTHTHTHTRSRVTQLTSHLTHEPHFGCLKVWPERGPLLSAYTGTHRHTPRQRYDDVIHQQGPSPSLHDHRPVPRTS
jgi:hypothetical protein